MKAILFRIPVIALLLGAFTFPAWSPARAEEMTCPVHTPVTIDIKPGSYPNRITLSSRGLVPVAVLTTDDFDASQFTPEMAHLSDANADMSNGCPGAMAVRWAQDDVNGDGQPDWVFFFNTKDLDLTTSSTDATFMAHGDYGSSGELHIIGTDSVKVKP
jgi:hypothetical protein